MAIFIVPVVNITFMLSTSEYCLKKFSGYEWFFSSKMAKIIPILVAANGKHYSCHGQI